jgi:DNA-binding beta-propeller fold protein YncE
MSALRVRCLLSIMLVGSLLGPNLIALAITANDAFDAVWSSTDQAVANSTASYSWFWGPTVHAQRFEPYLNSPGGQREVRYYDKSRMEINDPGGDPNNIYYVTNGLLTVELVTGKLKRGDGANDVEQHAPATQYVAGDLANNPGTPTYAAFANYVTTDATTNRATNQTGQSATAFMSGAGQVSTTDSRGVTLTYYEETTGHNIASVFWDWFNSPSSGFRPEIGINWVYAAGLPISEPYWIDSTVGGNTKRVLVQLFERRVLTYTESNNDPYRIEWGNIGLHYQTWRDAASSPAPCPASPAGTYLYVADSLNDRIQKFDAQGQYICGWTGDYDLDGPTARPQALAVDSQNNLYVNAIGRIEKYDQRGRFLGHWGSGINAWDMALDSQGNLYMTDVASSSVKKYDQVGNLIDEWGSLGSGDGQFDSLTGIAIDAQNNVYIADQWGSLGGGDGQFDSLTGIAIDAQNNVYIADRNNDRIQKFTSNGDYIDQWDADGEEADLWGFPASVAVDGAGNTYATSTRIYMFNDAGNLIDIFGEVGEITGSGDIDVAADGTIYAIDANNVRINRFSAEGALLDWWGSAGAEPGQFDRPSGIAASTR